jgi:hypothetical protein
MMHRAVQDARIQIAKTSNGRNAWGAYQHYGNPFFCPFLPTSFPIENEPKIVARVQKKTREIKPSAIKKKRVAKKARKAVTRSKR